MTKVYNNATDLITFARLQAQNTTSGSSYLGSDGLLKFAAEDEPRIEYGSDGSLKGLLIEEQRTNLVTYSGDLTDGSWSAIGIPTPTAISDGPYGLPAFEVTGLDTSGDRLDYTTGTAAQDGDTYTYSCWLKGSGTINITVNTTTGVGLQNEIAITLTDEWVRHSVTHTFSSPTGNVRAHAVITRTTGTAPTVYIAGPQIEQGPFPTSYIPTSGSTATRSADIASIPVSAFGYNQSAGTVVVEASSLAAVSGYYGSIVNIGSSNSDRIDLGTLNDAGWQSIRDDGIDTATYTNWVSHNIGSYGSGVTSTAGLAFKLNSANAAVNGSIGTEDTSCTIPTVSEVRIGYDFSSRFRNGHIKSLSYFPRRLTNAQLQELTA